MSKRLANVPALLQPSPRTRIIGAVLGQVRSIDSEGTAWVDFPGSEQALVPARRIGVTDDRALQDAADSATPVVLVFENGEPSLPLIMSVVASAADAKASPVSLASAPEVAEASEVTDSPAQLLIDGRRLVLQGTESIELRCGDASIVLRADGTLKLRGRDIASLARRRHRIKGGSVGIN